jgi:tripartite-type tricarboxylate transporter receptor subunit TctC
MEDVVRTFTRRAVLAGMAISCVLPSTSLAGGSTLRIVYPYPAGGSADAVVRKIAEHLQNVLGRTVIVENKTGAGGAIGALAVKQAAADGNTILFAAAAQFTLQPHVVTGLGYDPFADFVPVSQTITFDQALAVSGQIPVDSIGALAAWIQADPKRGKFGSPGEGTGAHLAGLAFGRKYGLALTHVPYRGTPAALPDLITGRLPIYIASHAELIASYRRGEVRILGTAGAVRTSDLPEIPTLREQGIDFNAPGWFGFYAPAGTPPEQVAILENHLSKAIKLPVINTFAESLGFRVSGTSAADLARIQREQFDHWQAVVKVSGLAMR